jgi:mRNA-degrading endonuclease toxin of MazEF toxin-antitoxin module
VKPPEGNLDYESEIACEQVRCISMDRLRRYYGSVSNTTMERVGDQLFALLDL